MTRKVVFVVLIVALGGIGAWLVAGYGRDDRGRLLGCCHVGNLATVEQSSVWSWHCDISFGPR